MERNSKDLHDLTGTLDMELNKEAIYNPLDNPEIRIDDISKIENNDGNESKLSEKVFSDRPNTDKKV